MDCAGGDDGLDVGAVEGAGLDGAVVGGGDAHVGPVDAAGFEGDVEAVGERLVGDDWTEVSTVWGADEDAAAVDGVGEGAEADV